jgi:hypothetical protein
MIARNFIAGAAVAAATAATVALGVSMMAVGLIVMAVAGVSGLIGHAIDQHHHQHIRNLLRTDHQ